MRVGVKIILLAFLFSCSRSDTNTDYQVYNDSVLERSIENTNTFTLIVKDVDSVELELWKSIGYKIDSLIQRNKTLEKKLGKSVRVIDKDGNVKNLGTLEDIKKRLKRK
tara:strand:+ start:2749 stop:3075 length:327 start_codon:yes stop_codon:yes gene_type:complete